MCGRVSHFARRHIRRRFSRACGRSPTRSRSWTLIGRKKARRPSMNPIMEHFFGQRGVTLAQRQTLKYIALAQEEELFVQYLHMEMWLSFLNGHDHAAI